MKFLPSTIINFHAVHNKQWMDNTLQLLNKLYNMVSLEEIKNYYYNGSFLKNACHITFDDGDKSFYNVVFPLLKKYNIPASIYISPKITINQSNFWFQEISDYDMIKFKKIVLDITRQNNNIEISDIPIKSLLKNIPLDIIMDAISIYQKSTNSPAKKGFNINRSQLQEIDASNLVTIGAHTLNHPILRNETDEYVKKEIIESIDGLANLLGKDVEYFAYPNGVPFLDFGQREMAILKKTSIKLAFSTEKKIISKSDDLLSIPRNGISKGSKEFISFKLLVGNNWDLLKRLIKGRQENDYRNTAL